MAPRQFSSEEIDRARVLVTRWQTQANAVVQKVGVAYLAATEAHDQFWKRVQDFLDQQSVYAATATTPPSDEPEPSLEDQFDFVVNNAVPEPLRGVFTNIKTRMCTGYPESVRSAYRAVRGGRAGGGSDWSRWTDGIG